MAEFKSADSLEDDFGSFKPLRESTLKKLEKQQQEKSIRRRRVPTLEELGFKVEDLPQIETKSFSKLIQKIYQNLEKPLVVKSHSKIKVLIVCSSALRVLEIIKDFKQGEKVSVAKLFARHLKLKEQIDALKSHSYQIGVGTPNRIVKILKDDPDAIMLSKVDVVIIDGSHRDKKEMSILDLKETRQDLEILCELLSDHPIKIYNF